MWGYAIGVCEYWVISVGSESAGSSGNGYEPLFDTQDHLSSMRAQAATAVNRCLRPKTMLPLTFYHRSGPAYIRGVWTQD